MAASQAGLANSYFIGRAPPSFCIYVTYTTNRHLLSRQLGPDERLVLRVGGLSGLFTKILIANRGEIACRIMRTCRRLGIATVAVYSEADSDALHVRSADEAVLIGPPAARASYLAIDRIMAAAESTGAEAIHPGYGFLSENPALARACKDAGLTFIGPSPEAIEVMGVKGPAKTLAMRVGVPVLEGAFPDDQAEASLRSAAEAIGW